MVTVKNSKFEALQVALKKYFERFPRLTVKALAMRTGVPYATLRRIMQSEVSDIKDETIFRIIHRVLLKDEQIEFIRAHYPLLEQMMAAHAAAPQKQDAVAEQFRRFHRMNPHNLILKLAQSKSGTSRSDIERLTGEYGLLALDEMLAAGLLIEEDGYISFLESVDALTGTDDMRHQISKDIEYTAGHQHTAYSLVRHSFGVTSPEALLRIIALSRQLLREAGELAGKEKGKVPFYLDVLVGSYNPAELPVRRPADLSPYKDLLNERKINSSPETHP